MEERQREETTADKEVQLVKVRAQSVAHHLPAKRAPQHVMTGGRKAVATKATAATSGTVPFADTGKREIALLVTDVDVRR